MQAWRAELESKKRGKLAAAVVDPVEHPELFPEGFGDAVAREATAEKEHPPLPMSGAFYV